MKEQYPILMEKAKNNGEVNSKDIMSEIGKLWKSKKEKPKEEVKEKPKEEVKEKKTKAKK